MTLSKDDIVHIREICKQEIADYMHARAVKLKKEMDTAMEDFNDIHTPKNPAGTKHAWGQTHVRTVSRIRNETF